MAENKILPKIPTIVREQPINASIISKMNTDKETRKVNPLTSNIPNVSMSTRDRIKNNENIVQLFPDVELSMQILTSSIISPNDMLTVSLIYDSPDIKIPSGIKQILIETIKKHIKVNYGLEDKLTNILREALFTKGAYIEAIIPEASLDDVINQYNNNGQVSLESFIDKHIVPKYNFLGDDSKSKITISSEQFAIKTDLKHFTKSKEIKKIEVTPDDLGLSVTDNPTVLNTSNLILNKTKDVVKDKIYGRKKLSTEDALDNIFKNGYNMKQADFVKITTKDDASRKSFGKPLVFKLPVESVIPVHVVNDPTKHLGYFVLLDINGAPIDSGSEIRATGNDIKNLANSESDTKLNIINKAKEALVGITKKDAKIDNLESIYSQLVEDMLKKKLKDGMFGDLVTIKDNADVYRVMLVRALKSQKTKLLFLPSELVAYYAFDYRENGTGKSLIEKVSLLFSIRSILLFSKLMATVKNSVTTTEVSATLDDNDIDPEKTMEMIISESLKTRQTQLPLGVTKIDDLVDWSHKVGFKYNFKHPSLPEMEITTSDTNTSKVIPDEELDRSIQEYIVMSFGLTPEIVQAGYNSDFATTVVAKNLLLAKRVSQTQNIFNPQIAEHVRKLITNDNVLIEKITEVVTNNIAEIKRTIKNQGDDEQNIDFDKIKDDDLIEYVVRKYYDEIDVYLPTPELNEAQAMKDAFETYKAVLEDYLELILSTDAIPDELAGEITGKLDSIKAVMKTILVKKWMNDNNYLPEISEFMTLDDNGKPIFDILEEYNMYIANLTSTLLPFLKQIKKTKTKTDEKLQKIEEGETEEEYENEEATVDTGDTNEENNNDETESEDLEEEPTDGDGLEEI